MPQTIVTLVPSHDYRTNPKVHMWMSVRNVFSNEMWIADN
jgi:hypothetical protein